MSDKPQWPLSAFTDEAGGSCEAQIAAAHRAGLNFIDIRNMDGHSIVAMPEEHAREARKKLDAAGLQVMMFGSPIGKIDIADDIEADLDKLRHLARLAPIFDCNAVRMFSYYNKAERPHDEWRDASIQRLQQLRELARELGLVLYHENERHIFGDLCRDVQIIVDAVRDGESFCTIFDFDNYNQSGETVWENWLQLRDVTDAIHLKDSRDMQHVPAGQGTGDVLRILQDAAARGWSGPVILEPHLSHSGAVAATGPSGAANQEYAQMPLSESFHAAATIGRAVIEAAGATIV